MCVWAPDIEQTNLRFLRGLDPSFFLYQAGAHSNATEARDAMHAALALRLNYGMAVEALFALLCAIVQAPDCVFGWLSAYRNEELRDLVERISSGQKVRSLQPFRPCTWRQVSAVLLAPLEAKDTVQHTTFTGLFEKAWKVFSRELLTRDSAREYNSLKHSFRVQPGGFKIDIEHDSGSLLKSESPFGHTFPYVKQMPGRKNHFDVKHVVMALEPEMLRASLKIIGCTISNIIAFARARAGDATSDLSVKLPQIAVFEDVWKERAPIGSIMSGGSVTVPENEYWSIDEILSVYDD